MASYLDKMRSSGGKNPFTPKEESPLAMFDQFLNRLPRGGLQQVGQSMQEPSQTAQPTPAGNINLIKPDKSKMNTVFSQMMTPAEQAKLEQRKAEQFGRERTAQAQIESRENIAKGTQGIRRDEVAIRKQMADIAQLKADRPDLIFKEHDSGEFYALDPKTGAVVAQFGKSMHWTDEEKNIAAGRREMNLEGSRAMREQALEAARIAGREKLIGVQGAENRETNAARPVSPVQDNSRVQMNYNRLINSDPEAAKHVKLDAQGMPQIDPVSEPSEGVLGFNASKGFDQATRDKYYQTIYGNTAPPAASATPPAPPSFSGVTSGSSTTGNTPPSTTVAPIKQYSPSRNETRTSTDGGKTWTITKGRG